MLSYSLLLVLVSEFTQAYAENISKYSWEILEKILGIVPRKFPGIGSEELLVGNYQEFSQILSKWVTRNSLDSVMLIFFGMGYKKFLEPGSLDFLRSAVDIFTGFSCERFLEISADSQIPRFLGISTDFPQNCYLGFIYDFFQNDLCNSL